MGNFSHFSKFNLLLVMGIQILQYFGQPVGNETVALPVIQFAGEQPGMPGFGQVLQQPEQQKVERL